MNEIECQLAKIKKVAKKIPHNIRFPEAGDTFVGRKHVYDQCKACEVRELLLDLDEWMEIMFSVYYVRRPDSDETVSISDILDFLESKKRTETAEEVAFVRGSLSLKGTKPD